MKRVTLSAATLIAFAGAAQAQDLTVGGFVAFEAIYGENYDVNAAERIPCAYGFLGNVNCAGNGR